MFEEPIMLASGTPHLDITYQEVHDIVVHGSKLLYRVNLSGARINVNLRGARINRAVILAMYVYYVYAVTLQECSNSRLCAGLLVWHRSHQTKRKHEGGGEVVKKEGTENIR
jgi:hypothetical protein